MSVERSSSISASSTSGKSHRWTLSGWSAVLRLWYIVSVKNGMTGANSFVSVSSTVYSVW